ncbi:thioredoxin domain-containing protein [Terricaulis sp.]|uniref:thioredoxin domain-containing protein n=1 Tax=Terricaulis sp. TaxID=2768686 RepID=UPI0037849A93
MQRLNTRTLAEFISEPGVAAVMFGAPHGEATMDQAVQFAEAWLECHDAANFGYVDAFESVAAARAYAVRVLPTTMIVNDGEVVAWIEGPHSSIRIAQAVKNAERVPVAA